MAAREWRWSTAPPPLVSRPAWSLLRPGSQAELRTTLREPDSCLMVSLRAPRELERYVFRPGGRSDSLVHAGGEEGLPEERAPWGGDAEVDRAVRNASVVESWNQTDICRKLNTNLRASSYVMSRENHVLFNA